MTKRALATPLSQLQSFLAFAKTDMPATGNALITELQKPKNCQQLSKRFANAPLDGLVAILRAESTKALWLAVLSQIELTTWQQRGRIKELQVDAFVAFQRLVTFFGRAELAAIPALNLVRSSTPAQWHQTTGLSHLSHVLRCAPQASTEEISQFLARIATPQWLDQQFTRGAKTGGLAGSCFALAINLPVESTRVFLRASLKNRVLRELSSCQICSIDALAEAVSLLGAASLLGLQLDFLPKLQLQNQRLLDLLHLRKDTLPIEQGVGPMQMQLCLGLRELIRHRMIAGDIPSEFLEEMLARLRITQAQLEVKQSPAHIRDSYAQMIVWLENQLL